MNMHAHEFLSPSESQKRLRQAMAMQEIEGNPLTPEEVEMFEMFDREGWSSEQRRALIIASVMGAPTE
jgi:hypothetical protein